LDLGIIIIVAAERCSGIVVEDFEDRVNRSSECAKIIITGPWSDPSIGDVAGRAGVARQLKIAMIDELSSAVSMMDDERRATNRRSSRRFTGA